MLELIKKSLLAGLGAVAITKEGLEKVTQKLVEEGKISAEEAQEFTEEVMKEGEKRGKEFQEKVAQTVKSVIEKLNLVPHSDFEELKARVEELEKRLKESKP